MIFIMMLEEYSPSEVVSLVSKKLRDFGCKNVKIVDGPWDGEIDILCYRRDNFGATEKIVVQVKHLSGKANRKEIEYFHNVIRREKAVKGIFFSTNGFTKTAYKYVEEYAPGIIILWDKRILEPLLNKKKDKVFERYIFKNWVIEYYVENIFLGRIDLIRAIQKIKNKFQGYNFQILFIDICDNEVVIQITGEVNGQIILSPTGEIIYKTKIELQAILQKYPHEIFIVDGDVVKLCSKCLMKIISLESGKIMYTGEPCYQYYKKLAYDKISTRDKVISITRLESSPSTIQYKVTTYKADYIVEVHRNTCNTRIVDKKYNIHYIIEKFSEKYNIVHAAHNVNDAYLLIETHNYYYFIIIDKKTLKTKYQKRYKKDSVIDRFFMRRIEKIYFTRK